MTARSVAWTAEAEATLSRLLELANGRRRGRLLTLPRVRACAEEALAAPEGYAWCHGGEVDDARALTSVCLAVLTPAGLTVGVSSAHAQGVTPARAWADLKTWERFHGLANVPECRAWASRPRGDRVRLEVSSQAEPARGVDGGLLAAVLASPHADAPRSVLADWWTERGEARGELVALQLEREGLAAGDPRREQLLSREGELLEAHGARWVGSAVGVARVRFRRGFVEDLSLVDADGLRALGELFAREPVLRLTVETPRRVDCLLLAQSPWVARLEALAFESARTGAGRLGVSGLQQLLTSQGLRGLRALRFVNQGLGDEGVAALARQGAALLPGLRELAVERDTVTARGVEALLATRWSAGLEGLSFSHNALGPGGVEALTAKKGEARLQRLELGANAIGDRGAFLLAASPRMGALRRLALPSNGITRAGLDALLGSGPLQHLEVLDLSGNWLGKGGRERLESRFSGARPSDGTGLSS